MSESDIQQKKDQQNDEIDVFEFCSRIWTAFKYFIISLKELAVSVIIFFIRKLLWIVSFALTGMVAGYLYYGISKPTYISSLEGNTGGLECSMIINHVNKLEQVAGKPALMAKYLNMTEDQAKVVKSVKAFYGIDVNRDARPDYVDFQETYNPKDTNQIRVLSYVYIQVDVFNEDILPILRKGLFQYINRNSYLQELYRIDREQKVGLMAQMDLEINKIDSLQRVRYRKGMYPDNTQIIFMGNESESKLFHDDILKLYRQKQELEKEFKTSAEIITVVQDFTPLSKEENPVLTCIVSAGFMMAVLGLFCAILWQYREKIRILIREDSTKR